jgi:hypothetical protein
MIKCDNSRGGLIITWNHAVLTAGCGQGFHEFGSRFPNNASLSSHLSATSDHIPLLVNIPTSLPKTHLFRFENSWLKNPDFLPSILSVWFNSWVSADPTGGLVTRIKAVIRHVAKNLGAQAPFTPRYLPQLPFLNFAI